MLTLMDFWEQCFLDTISPEMLKAFSTDVFELQTHKYFCATLASMGNVL